MRIIALKSVLPKEEYTLFFPLLIKYSQFFISILYQKKSRVLIMLTFVDYAVLFVIIINTIS